MRRVVLAVLLAVSVSACSRSTSSGSESDGELGNIPLAEAGGALADVNFDYDSSEISTSAQSVLRDNAKWLLDNPNAAATIEGHCDERGTVEYNLALGERRARAAHDFLRSLGVKQSQLSTVSYGEELPLDPGHSEDAWAKNRRDHFRVGR